MLRIDIPEIEIPAETERTVRTIVGNRAVPGGEPSDKFLYQPLEGQQITVWADSLMNAALSVYRFAVAGERKRAERLHRLANLDQALRLIRQEVDADSSVSQAEKGSEAMRRAYRLGKAHAEMEANLPK